MKFAQLLLMTGVSLMTLASAQEPAPSQNQGQQSQEAGGMSAVEGYLKTISEKLNLTADQITQIKPVLQNQLAQLQTVRKDSSLTAGQKLDKIRSIHDETHAKIRDVLTDDQKKKFDAMQAEMHDHMQHHPPSQGGNPPPPK